MSGDCREGRFHHIITPEAADGASCSKRQRHLQLTAGASLTGGGGGGGQDSSTFENCGGRPPEILIFQYLLS